jgi:hypothetical protein
LSAGTCCATDRCASGILLREAAKGAVRAIRGDREPKEEMTGLLGVVAAAGIGRAG